MGIRATVLGLTAVLALALAPLSARAELVYYWAWGTNLVNAQSCTGATPHNTCDLDPHGAAIKRMNNIGGTSWKGAGAVCGANGTFSTGPTGIASGAYTLSSTWSLAGCTGTNTGAVTVYRSNVACDTTVSTSPCYVPPPQDDCAAGKFSMIGNRGVTFASAFGNELTGRCWGLCKVNISEAGPGMDEQCDGAGVCTFSWVGIAKTTGEACAGGAAVPNPEPADPDQGEPFEQYAESENCVVSAAGVEVCTSFDPDRSKENCGYVNDEFTCLDKVSSDNCWVMPSGGRLCGEGATPPAAPTAPAPAPKSQTATPTDRLASNTTNNTYNYYNSGVVSGSQRPVTSDGSNPVTGSGGATGDGTGTEEGAGKASGGETCAAAPTCSGDPIECAQLLQQWRQRCPNPMTEAEMRAGITDSGIGADGMFPSGSSVSVGEGDFDATGFLGGRSCPLPTSFDLGQFGAVAFDATQACALLNALAAMILAAGWLTAARVAFGS